MSGGWRGSERVRVEVELEALGAGDEPEVFAATGSCGADSEVAGES